MKIECPMQGGSAENCAWSPRAGRVRDFPEVGVIECTSCRLVTHSRDLSPKVDYKSGSMHKWTEKYGGVLSKSSSDPVRRISLIKLLATEYELKLLLDFGCGSGKMLDVISKSLPVVGIEPDDSARKNAIESGHKVFDSIESFLEAKCPVDVVSLFHVVEHFYEATMEISRIYDFLQPGGFILIETPNSNDAMLTKYESREFQNFTYWSHHPMLHSHESLEGLLTRCGFKVLKNIGVQRYNLNNHLYWLSKGLPGGHEIWEDFISPIVANGYSEELAKNGMSDTIWMVARKPYRGE